MRAVTRNEFVDFASDHLTKQGYDLSQSASEAFQSSRLVNPKLLETLPEQTVRENTVELLEEIASGFEARRAREPRSRKLRDIDVRPALKRRFCSLPPFCR